MGYNQIPRVVGMFGRWRRHVDDRRAVVIWCFQCVFPLTTGWCRSPQVADQFARLSYHRVIALNCTWRVNLLTGDTRCVINTLRPRRNRRHFADDIFKCIFLNENVWIALKISLKFVPKVRINNIPALVQIMALRRPGDKPLSEPMMVSLLTHICVTRPQWMSD